MRFDPEQLDKTDANITQKADAGEGMPFDHLRGQGIQQADNLTDDMLLLLVRAPSGHLNLTTFGTRWF
jgi:hypothetical protein